MAGLIVSVTLRVLSGDATLGLPALMPWLDMGEGIEFPFRTVAMLCGLVTAVVVSRLTASKVAPRPLGLPS